MTRNFFQNFFIDDEKADRDDVTRLALCSNDRRGTAKKVELFMCIVMRIGRATDG